MASCPPLPVEDQTDEDFFDKLVDDDYAGAASGPGFVDGSESDEVKALANLSLGEVLSGADDSMSETKEEAINPCVNGELAGLDANEGKSIASPNSSGIDNAIQSKNDATAVDDTPAPIRDQSGGASASGVKELQWSSFNTDTGWRGPGGFGSYSDFFTQLEDRAQDIPGEVEDSFKGEANVSSGSGELKNGVLTNLPNYDQYSGGQGYVAGADNNENLQESSSIENWDNLYPGWKYDPNTCQWYQVDDLSAIENVQESFNFNSTGAWPGSDGNLDASYTRQTVQSVAGTVADAGSVLNFNQVSQGYSEYPEHMVFDPQYPGWYYDTIIQEWRSLDTYSSSTQQTFQSTDQQNLNGFSAAGINSNNHKMYDDGGKAHNQGFQGIGTSQQYGDWSGSYGNYNQQQSLNKWQPTVNKAQTVPGYSENQLLDNTYASNESVSHVMDQQKSFNSTGMVPLYNGASLGTDNANGNIRLQQQGFIFGGSFNQPLNQSKEPNEQYNYYGNQHAEMFSQQSLQSSQQFAYASNVGRSSAGRPPHALVHFGFGGKLITTKYTTTQSNMSYDNQDHMGGSIHVHNLLEVVTGKNEAPSFGRGACTYFHSLCQQSFPGPLVGGNAGTKDLNKWLDERIANCDSLDMDCGKGEHLRLLLSLLKIACQHYGKLRSPFGTDTSSREGENPESAVAKLFASAKKHGGQLNAHGAVAHCLQNFPPEGQMLATAAAMQSLLVSGRTREALQCAQEGQLWGPALVLAAQLGDQFYADTVKQMALHQLMAGSPLRTLCLLIAGQHADVFSMGAPVNHGYPVSANVAQQSGQVGVNVLLDDWEDNLAVVTANRTKDDELVIIHLGDCLWKERSEIVAAHICYIVAEANFEPCSDSARLCLIGADHWKFPRTFASPEAIQRTELYEYSKVLGNSQFILLPFQPYKLVYAHMLAEVGKVSDALKYCQAVLKSIKTGREPVVETWKQLVLSLEERLKGHQQGGFTTNLAPAKLVGKLFNLFDSTAHRVVGSFPPVPPASQTSVQDNGHPHEMMAPRVLSSHSTMAMSSLMPSTSMEPINEWTADGSRMARHNRSVSEPDFGRTPRQADSSKQEATSDAQGNKAQGSSGPSRFGRLSFGSQLFQKTVGLVLKRPQAKLGEKNKFYYDEKLKRWVEEGVEPPSEEPALPPPPTTSSLNNGMSDYPSKNVLKSGNSPTGWSPEQANSAPHELSSGIPPIPPTSNQFSARGRTGVRSRYVDTFNQGNGAPVNLFQSPSAPSFKSVSAAANPKFFVPVPASPSPTESTPASMPDTTVNENPSTSDTLNSFHFSPAPSSPTIQRFPSMGNISDQGGPGAAATRQGPGPLSSHSRRTASWSGSISDSFSPPKSVGSKPFGAGPLVPMNGGVALGDELHEVEL